MHSKRCRLRATVYKAVDSIIAIVTEQPGGYTFWIKQSNKRRHNIRRACTDAFIAHLLSDDFMTMLVQAACAENGQPLRHSNLYDWLLKQVYSGDVKRLYADWLKVKGQYSG